MKHPSSKRPPPGLWLVLLFAIVAIAFIISTYESSRCRFYFESSNTRFGWEQERH